MKTDRLLKIYVGRVDEDTQPFRVHEAVLEQASPYFANMMEPDAFCEDEHGVLRFPNDDLQAWEVLLYWIVHHEIPKRSIAYKDALAIRCWQLGDKYLIPDFQDHAMLSLLYTLRLGEFSFQVIEEGVLRSTAGSKLRKLVLQEAVNNVFDGYTTQLCMLSFLDGLGCITELLYHYHKKCMYSDVPQNRIGADVWEEYMMMEQEPEILKAHWAFKQLSLRKRKFEAVYSESETEDEDAPKNQD